MKTLGSFAVSLSLVVGVAQVARGQTFHDVPETVDNAPIRIYRIGDVKPAMPTMFAGSSGKRWQLTNDDLSAPITAVRIWAGQGNYGGLPFLGEVPVQPGDRIQLDFTNAGMDHHTVTIRQDSIDPVSGKAPLWLEDDDFVFEQQMGFPHRLKLDAANDPKYTLNSVRVNNTTICVRTGPGGSPGSPCGFTNNNGWKVQIKICNTLTATSCTQKVQQ